MSYLVADTENVRIEVDDVAPEALALIIADARRHKAESFYLRVNDVPVHFNAALDWRVE